MNIEEFLKLFNDIIPYKFKLKIGGSKSDLIISGDKELISYENHKGKKYPIYKKDLFKKNTEYIPLDKIDVPIELTIQCSHSHILEWEKKHKSTKKERTSFQVRILNEDASRQLGYLSLELTKAGDIENKFCTFYNETGTREIMQAINYEYDEKTKKIIPIECLSFIFYNLETGLEEKISFNKEDGILKCITINKQGLKNHAFDSIVWSNKVIKEKQEFFSRYRNNAVVEQADPLVCDFTNYIINKDYTDKLQRIKELQTILNNEGNPLFNRIDYNKIRKEIECLKDPKNGIFSDFYGEYIGNTIIKSNSKLILVLETLKDDFHYFTSVDISNTDAFDVDFYHERYDGTLYYQAIKKSDKKPMFRTKIVNEEEVLIPIGNNITDDEIRNYKYFKSFCKESFNTIEREKTATLSLNKYSKGEKNQQLIKKKTNIKHKK